MAIVRPVTYYGVTLTGPAIEEEPERRSVGALLWSIIKMSMWLMVHGLLWLAFIVIMAIVGLIVVMSARV